MKRRGTIFLFFILMLAVGTQKIFSFTLRRSISGRTPSKVTRKALSASHLPSKKYKADISYGSVGLSDKVHLDNAYDNVFHIRLPATPRKDETVSLQYEVKGVTSHIGIARSINEGQSTGGYFVQTGHHWVLQKEFISATALRKGDNVVRFGLPGQAGFRYEIRNVAIIVEQRKSDEPIQLNLPDERYFGDAAYITGILHEPAKLTCNNIPVPVHQGEFEIFLKNPNQDKSAFSALLKVTLPSGRSAKRIVYFKTNVTADHRFRPEEKGRTNEAAYHKNLPLSLRLKNVVMPVSLYIPSGALQSDVKISITALRDVDIAPLNSDMVNVTGFATAYRFLPHGSKFGKAVRLKIPYDANLLPKGYTKADIHTFFFDENARSWVMLPADTSKMPDGVVGALTTHFTDMINGIIKVPESPQTQGYTPTSIKDYKAADPSAGIEMIAPPMANNMGSASLSYPIKLPKGRLGLQPALNIQYNNEGTNGWLGLGWNLAVPSIGIDTRWGVPRYDPANETETYTMNGGQLAPLANRTAFVARTADKVFHPRIEGSFERIIRHGNSPANYWWEVTNKSGVASYYGGTPASGVSSNAILTDASGNIAEWKLVETIDLHGNNVRYNYMQVADAGISGGSVPGYQLYLSDIYYTGFGASQNGPYHVGFIRSSQLGEPRRTDVEISGRLGFKMVTADLLRQIKIDFNGRSIRSYELQYQEGEFYKTLLKNVSELDTTGAVFNTHTFDYYDDVKSSGYLGAVENWSPANDNIKGDFLTGIPGFTDESSALNTSKSSSAGGGLTVAIGLDNGEMDKSNTVGGSLGYDGGNNEGLVAMVDINGDGLPDKVFKQNGALYYRPNLGLTAHGFGAIRPITGIGNFSAGSSQTVKWGVQLLLGGSKVNPASASLGYEHSSATNTTTDYFADFNGDGLIDVASGGQVYFNHLDPNGNPTFTTLSTPTPNPVLPGGSVAKIFLLPDTALQHQQETQFPLQDAIRFWQAPFDGTITINAPVQLLAGPSGAVNQKLDGVRASIQLSGNVLWSTTIAANDLTVKTPVGVSNITVKKGQRIYFRLQSNYNGDGDHVQWNPVITYQNSLVPAVDANNRSSLTYQASKDFILDNRNGAMLPADGTISVNGTFTKGITSDTVTIIISKRHNGVGIQVYRQACATGKVSGTISIPSLAVNQGDTLLYAIQSDSYVDRTVISCIPHYVYTAFTSGIPAVSASGIPTLDGYVAPDNTNYNNWLNTANSFTDAVKDTVVITPIISGSMSATGAVTFTVKGIDTIYAKEHLQVTAGQLSPPGSIKLVLNPNTPYFFDYAASDATFAAGINSVEASLQKDTTVKVAGVPVVHAVTHTFNANLYANPSVNYLGPLFRGWGQFSYKGNQNNAPIDETKLNMNQYGVYPSNPSLISPDTLTFKSLQSPVLSDFVPMSADAKRNLWVGLDTSVYVASGTMSSSRLWLHNVSIDSLMQGASLLAVEKVSVSNASNYSLGGGYSGYSGGANYSTSNSSTRLDMMDMNGDHYPDVLSQDNVQYTLPVGALETTARTPHNLGGSSSKATSIGATLGGEFDPAKSINSTALNAILESLDAKASIGLSANIGTNNQESNTAWIDVNGDGLPDKVYSNGLVALNLGYAFAPAENWGIGAIDKNNSTSLGGGGSLGFNWVSGSFEGGFGLSRSTGTGAYTLTDINGDGLVDQVSANGVTLNTGAGFGPQISWSNLSAFSNNISTGESANVAISYGFPVFILKVIFNPAIYGGHGLSREQDQIMDIDGDGFPDILHSDNDGNLTVMRSTIGRTNMLRTVTRPMGAFFTIDYQRTNNTYKMPQNKWVMKSMALFDGLSGDGVDTMRTTFSYAGGYYDRREREFYGFDTVITNHLNTANNNALYRSNVSTYINNNYYTKNLMQSEWLQDAAGNKYTETDNQYSPRLVQDSVQFPLLSQITRSYYEGQKTLGARTFINYQYDLLGNVIMINDTGDGSTQDDVIATVTYQNNAALYIVGIPASIEVNTSVGIQRKRTTQINNYGDITEISQFQANGTASVYDMEYDSYGNLSKITRPANATGQRLFYAYEYNDGFANTYVTKVTDGYGYTSTSQYEPLFGNVTQTIDMQSEPMKFAYDNKGRLDTVVGPYEIAAAQKYTLAFEYFPDAAVPYAITHHYDPEYKDNINIVTFMDGLGRAVQVKKQSSLFKGKNQLDAVEMVVSGRVLFDAFGRTISNYYPVIEPINGTNNSFNRTLGNIESNGTFDVEDRPLKEILADGATTTMVYTAGAGFLITNVTDPLGNKEQTLTDVRNRKREEDLLSGPAGTIATKFNYDALDELTSVVDNNGNTTSYTYDNLGRKLSVNHPDAGLTSFVYDDAGNMTQKITAQMKHDVPQGGAINYLYEYERLIGIDYPIQYQNKVTYKYGAPGIGDRAGRLILQEDASGGLEYYYGKLGEITKQIRTVMVSKIFYTTYVSEQTYDTWNRIKTMTYPDGEQVTYHYNFGGNLQSIDGYKLGNNYSYVSQLGYDEYGQRVYLRYGNGTETNYSYDVQRRRLATLQATTATGRLMMDNTYSYDLVSNILGIANNAKILAPYPGGPSQQNYAYDNLYRLTSAKGSYRGPNGFTASYGMALDYDNLYNITTKKRSEPNNQDTYTLNYSYGTKPHEPSAIQDNKATDKYTYDLNGNQLGHGTRDNFWDEENRQQAILDNGTLSLYTYDAGGERVIKSSGGVQGNWVNGAPAGTITHYDNYTVYVSPYLVCTRTGFTKHIYIESQRIVSQVGNGSFTNINYPQPALTAGGIDYVARAATLEQERVAYYSTLGVPPGPPTNKLFYAEPQNSHIVPPILVDNTASSIPAGWPGNTIPPITGPPVYVSSIPSNDSVKAGYGFKGTGHFYETDEFFYHTDHLGSTAYLTDVNGQVYQHEEYTPFGEIYVDDPHSGYNSPYLFNGKEQDGETGLYYYGARYYDPKTSIWLSVDPMADKYPGLSPYNYDLENPVKLIDPDGNCPNCLVGAAIGATISVGIEAYSQYHNSGHIDNLRALAGSFVQGALTGAVAGATGGASLFVSGAANAGANIVGGIANRSIQDHETTLNDVTEDGIIGGGLGIVGKFAGGGVENGSNNLSNSAKGALGEAITKLKYASKGYISNGLAEVETGGVTETGRIQLAKYDHAMQNIITGKEITVESKFNTSDLTKNQRASLQNINTPGGLIIDRTTSQQLRNVTQSTLTGGTVATANQLKGN